MKRSVFALASLVATIAARDAFAANVCISAADKGQDLRASGKLDEARATFMVCAKPTCNRVVRADCERWIKEIDDATRAAAEAAKEAAKEEPPTAAVASPSPAPSAAPASTSAPMRVSLAISDPAPGAPSTFPFAPVVLGGIGVASLAAFAFLQVQGWSQYSSLENGCARTHSCTDADISPSRTAFVGSGVALGISVVSLGAAAILYFTRGKDSTPSSRVGIVTNGASLSF